MDDTKDTKKNDQIGRFLDNHTVRTNPFGRNVSGEKAYARAERLVSALHLLTNHVPFGEPARESARKIGLRLLSDVLLLRDEMRIPNSTKTQAAQVSVRELISHIRMLAISGFVSFQNADIVIEALDELGNFLSVSQRSSLSENVVLRREDLLTGGYQTNRALPGSLLARAPLVSHTRTKTTVSDIKDSASVKDIIKIKDKKESETGEIYRTVKSGARTQEILGILESSGELGIRDIALNLPEYSEKMIQRELSGLVADQIVKKTGVKRWSRYSLAR
ncbi:hypothetical protein A3F27_03300 [Candidatus Kaiserbacteria bacterium RIFCSPHIGHO2_12_FULL_53_13]|uniref:HTH deoR-type domain-containing protein n=1 Tax=Candidatus Kaiserbacteria bacterium RIFCSPHIGHO2_12_FULL_53_13 TaxID=1798502 RepID=A0A1F6E8N4_9BACT|nr:MAG: hypothetical protein A3F27_03300 [Candidatus Kaiserbacteria bacterium RIFCSPHIGHO2_12_FULL_53_13]OGG74347.1 MAG: hypothetical protein A3A37_02600 [Candidatus Kaiserbacteria bacterium RIFCSPLOWO2_01_FULL_52_36]